jgi:hypothetical protein
VKIGIGLIGFLFGIISWKLVWKAIKCFPSTRLRIDQQRISLNNLPPSPRWAICKLSFTRPSVVYSEEFLNIQIWAGTREYKFLTSHLTKSEVDWIAHELSEWLDLPII